MGNHKGCPYGMVLAYANGGNHQVGNRRVGNHKGCPYGDDFRQEPHLLSAEIGIAYR